MFPYFEFLGKRIGSYGIMMMLGFVLVGALSTVRGKKRGVCFADLMIVAGLVLFGAIIGGNLLYIFITYPLADLISMMEVGDFSFLINGGIVFYGGLIGAILCTFLGARIAGCGFHKIEKTVVPLVPLGHAIGRIGCLLGGCCHGMPYDGPLAVYYPNSLTGLPKNQGYFPVQPLEAILNVGICLILIALEKKIKKKYVLLLSYLGIYAVIRFFLEFLRGDEIRGVYFGISSSQWIAIGMLGISVLGIWLCSRKKNEI